MGAWVPPFKMPPRHFPSTTRGGGREDTDKAAWIPRMDEVPAGQTPQAVRLTRPRGPEVVLALQTERTYQIGRAETADLYFDDDGVSRYHGFLYFAAEVGAWMFRDTGSAHGSFLLSPKSAPQPEEVRGSYPAAVVAGCRLRLGDGTSQMEFLPDVPAEVLGPAKGTGWKATASRELEARIRAAASHSMPLLLLGASGAGKTYVARQIHRLSGRAGPFVPIDCTHLPTDRVFLHSQLLGHVKGAFTGAVENRVGQLFLADAGTLFLDEVESLVPEAQGFLLTLLEGEDGLAPLGAPPSKNSRRPHCRLIAASKQPLNASPLRKDLTQRLGAGDYIHLPSLEDRRDDIPALALGFLENLATTQNVNAELSTEALAYLCEQVWPGQIRELEATVKTTATRCWALREPVGMVSRRVVVGLGDLESYRLERAAAFGSPSAGESPRSPPAQDAPISMPGAVATRKRPVDLTRQDVETALRAAGWVKTHAAQALGLSPTTLREKMKEFGIADPRPSRGTRRG